MVDLHIKKGKLELAGYTGDTTLTDLAQAVETYAASLKKQSVQCRMCGECCQNEPVLGLDIKILSKREGMGIKEWAEARLMPPQFPDLNARRKLIAEFRRNTGMPELEATVLYEVNQYEPMPFKQDERGRCMYQKGKLCSDFGKRAFVCRLYLCKFGEKLQALEEMIAAQGTWHAWHLLGGVPEEMIGHNPFLRAETYGDVLIKDFEYKFDEALKELFIYF